MGGSVVQLRRIVQRLWGWVPPQTQRRIRQVCSRISEPGLNLPVTEEVVGAFRIAGCRTFEREPEYLDPESCPNFQGLFEDFLEEVALLAASHRGQTFVHLGDGDYYFLTGQPIGSARPGFRALSKPLSAQDLKRFNDGFRRFDKYMLNVSPKYRKWFHELLPNTSPDYPTEVVYASIASRRLFRNVSAPIGIIGAEEKVDLIKRLSQHDLYLDYLGVDGFCDFISVPQRFACDDLNGQIESVTRQLTNAKSKVFLVGIGSLKLGLLPELPRVHEAVYLDVGSGIDALAGIVDPWRPYFGDWINFQFEDPSLYEKLDLLQVSRFRSKVVLPG